MPLILGKYFDCFSINR